MSLNLNQSYGVISQNGASFSLPSLANQLNVFKFSANAGDSLKLNLSFSSNAVINFKVYDSHGLVMFETGSTTHAGGYNLYNGSGNESLKLLVSGDYYFSIQPTIAQNYSILLKTALDFSSFASIPSVPITLPSQSSSFVMPVDFTQATVDRLISQKTLAETARDTALADKTTALSDLATVTAQKMTVEIARDTALADKATALSDLATVTAQKMTVEIARDTALADKATALTQKTAAETARDTALVEKATVLAQVTAAETALDLAISEKTAGLAGFASNILGVDVASSTGAVTFSKTKADYVAFDSDKKITGNLLANKITTGTFSTAVSAGDGNDTVNGGVSNDTIDGGKGDDTINAADGNNSVIGGIGNDSITAGYGNDKIDGGDDNDTINAGDGLNTVIGGKGDDSITSGIGNDKIDAGDGNDTVNAGYGNNSVSGGNGDDSIFAGYGADSLDGGAGNDVISSSGANSKLIGGAGDDSLTLFFISEPDGVISHDTLDGGAGNDVLTLDGFDGFHKLLGGAGNDKISHYSLGAATLDGGSGNDFLSSRSHLDVLTGGAGADVFEFTWADGSVKISDFKTAVDKIYFNFNDNSPETAFALALSAFHSGKGLVAPTATTDHFIYNLTTGALFYDADGSGVDFQTVQVALIANKAALVASDILV
jgi:Ca2+-binding RTX toxin-like protein